MKKIVLIVSFFVLFAHAASFNCTKARTSIEKQICSDANLSVLDEELAKVYKKVLQLSIHNKLSKYDGSSNYNFFKQKQKKWLKARNKNCSKYKGNEQKECLLSYYTSRIEKLKEFDDGAMVYRNFGHLIYLYTHRPDLLQFFKPYLDKKSYKKLSKEILAWEKSYEVCRNRFGVLDENCTKKVAKEKRAYYDTLLTHYKNNRYLKTDGKCIKLKRNSFSFEQEDICHIYNIYKKSEIQKLCKKEPEFNETKLIIPKNAKACSRDSHRIFYEEDESISLLSKNIVVIKTENFDYTGGLHGDYESNYLNLDRNSGKIIQWNDIFTQKKKVLYPFIVRHMRNLIDLEYLEKLSDNELCDMATATNRMQLTPKGVVVWFGLYEISGYANGEPSFLVPLKKLKKVMTHEKFIYYFAKPIKLYSICN